MDIESLVIEKGNFRVREDNEEFFIIVNRDDNRWLSANRVTIELINLVDGKKSVQEITEEFSKEFEDADLEQIRKDVKEVFEMALRCNFVHAKES